MLKCMKQGVKGSMLRELAQRSGSVTLWVGRGEDGSGEGLLHTHVKSPRLQGVFAGF